MSAPIDKRRADARRLVTVLELAANADACRACQATTARSLEPIVDGCRDGDDTHRACRVERVAVDARECLPRLKCGGSRQTSATEAGDLPVFAR
ncbi:hypothetical protein [Burkholderia ambifaria]|uniref:hypothetical protein n=1 Tax=Burkholderia ambifaria TaxID=152480 RepID=UPI00158EC8D5|nr:hypothetical protein [Burkholderia ambifaria]